MHNRAFFFNIIDTKYLLLNIRLISETRVVDQASKGWLKLKAAAKGRKKPGTHENGQEWGCPINQLVPSNVPLINVTRSVFHELSGWLKLEASTKYDKR